MRSRYIDCEPKGDHIDESDRIELGQGVWYDRATGYVMLDVSGKVPQIEPIEIGGVRLEPKDELHVTIINIRKYTDEIEAENEAVDVVRAALTEVDLGEVEIGEIYLCQQGVAVSVVGLVNVDGFDSIQRRLLEVIKGYQQLPHVTLATNEAAPRGIAVESGEKLARIGIKITPERLNNIEETKTWEDRMSYGSTRFESATSNNHNVVYLKDVEVPTKLVLGKDVALVLPKNPSDLPFWSGYPTHQESWLPLWFVLLNHSQPKSVEDFAYRQAVAERVTDEDYDLVQKALIYKASEFWQDFQTKNVEDVRKKYKNLTRILQDILIYVDGSDEIIDNQQEYLVGHELYPLVERANELRSGIGMEDADAFEQQVEAILTSYVDQFSISEVASAYRELLDRIAADSVGEVVVIPNSGIHEAEKYAELVSYDLLMADDEHDKDVVSIVPSLRTPEFHQLVTKSGRGLSRERRVDVIAVPDDLGVWDVALGGKESYQPISMILATHTVPKTNAGLRLQERLQAELMPEFVAHHYLGATEEFLNREAWGKSFVKRIEKDGLPQIKKVIPLYRVACDLLPRAVYMLKTGRFPAGVSNDELWRIGEVEAETAKIEELFVRQDATQEELSSLYGAISKKLAAWAGTEDYELFLRNMEIMRQQQISGFEGTVED